MGSIAKLPLSGSSQGKPILIAATASTGTTVHATGTSSTIIDEVWLYCTNNDTISRNITIEFGATGTGNQITASIPAKSGLSILVTGLVLTGTGSVASTITAFSNVTNVISISGYINRLTP